MKSILGSFFIILILVGVILFAAFPIWQSLRKTKDVKRSLRSFSILDIVASMSLLFLTCLHSLIPKERLRIYYGDLFWINVLTVMVAVLVIVAIFVSVVAFVFVLKNWKVLKKLGSVAFEAQDVVRLGVGMILAVTSIVVFVVIIY